jgi:hypothetical protein
MTVAVTVAVENSVASGHDAVHPGRHPSESDRPPLVIRTGAKRVGGICSLRIVTHDRMRGRPAAQRSWSPSIQVAPLSPFSSRPSDLPVAGNGGMNALVAALVLYIR